MNTARALRVLLLAAALLLAACAWLGAAPNRLSNTTWRLQAIQSMDDTQGTTRPPASKQYKVRFGADGRASLQLDCNRGTGAWQATAAADGSGSLTFGPIAATRALCAPPHLDERIVRDLGYVRGYLIRDGKLFLTLMADGGIYEWHPHRE